MLLALPVAVVATSLAQLMGRGDGWDAIDRWLYGALGLSILGSWLLLLRRVSFTASAVLWPVVSSAVFLSLKLGLLLLLASPPVMMAELTESFFWLTPVLLCGLLAQDSPLARRVALGLLGWVSALSAAYGIKHLTDPAARTVVMALLQLNLAAWVSAVVVRLYVPQRERLTLASGERAALEKLAYTDLLTGLPNRLHLEQSLDEHVKSAADTPLTLLFIDLNSFKVVNDTLGHAEGDRLLCSVSQVLLDAAPQGLVCRLSGDEFVVALPGQGIAAGMALSEVIQRQLARSSQRWDFRITASIGMSVYPDDAQTPAELLRHADSAMYAVKRGGKANVRRYRQADAVTERNQILARDLLDGLERREFSLLYQPIFELSSAQPVKVEALLRWQHPSLGAISPEHFIPVAERGGGIAAVGQWALREACRTARRWPGLRVCVNVSALQLFQRDFAQQVEQALTETGLSAAQLELEFTETMLLPGDAHLTGVLRDLRCLGVALCIDDFGTGYSNLSRLRTLPVQGLKLDRSFTAALSSPAERAYPLALMEAVVKIGTLRGIEVTIEGIETAQQLTCVRELGQVLVQGRLLGEPLSAEQVGQPSAALGLFQPESAAPF